MKIKCLECGAEFDALDDIIIGEIVTCPDCGLELEVSRIAGGKVDVKTTKCSGEDWGE